MQSGFLNNILLFNARSICNKIPDLHYFLRCQNPSVIFITETWLKPGIIHDATLSPPRSSYEIYRCDRAGSVSGGGVLAMVHCDISHHFISSKNFSVYCQCLTICFHTSPLLTYVTLVYRSPICDRSSFYGALREISESLKERTNSIILGDFNFPMIKWQDTSSTQLHGSAREFYQFCESNMLTQLVNLPTHSFNILDLVLTNNTDLVQNITILAPFSTSDHRAIFLRLIPAK